MAQNIGGLSVAITDFHFEDGVRCLEVMHHPPSAPKTLAGRQFNVLTPENEMKWANTEPQRGRFSFDAGDQLVKFAQENNMKVRGHALVWYQAAPGYLETLSAEQLREAMLEHVKAVATH